MVPSLGSSAFSDKATSDASIAGSRAARQVAGPRPAVPAALVQGAHPLHATFRQLQPHICLGLPASSMRFLSILVVLATAQLATCQQYHTGFNYGSTFTTGAAKTQADFAKEFRSAASLSGAPQGFTSARLYTNIQAGTPNDPISAIPAAIETKTSLLLGLWASAGAPAFANELESLRKSISTYGDRLKGVVLGISVGSEDLYRNSPTGKANKENAGADPGTIVDYIAQTRAVIKGTVLDGVPIGHVDTWTEWVNVGRNQAVINAVDWLGFDGYPYFETTAAQGNSIDQNKALFDSSLQSTRNVAAGKAVWITETGFPVSGKTSGSALPSVENARKYWQQVGCAIVGSMNVYWYTLQDAAPNTPNPSFGILDSSGKQLYDLSCNKAADTARSSGSSPGTESPGASDAVEPPLNPDSRISLGATGQQANVFSIQTQTSVAGIGEASPSSAASDGDSSIGFTIQTETSITNTATPEPTSAITSGSTASPVSSSRDPTATQTQSETGVPGLGAAVNAGSFAAAFAAILGAVFYL
ncbi:GPI-anchored cell wall beta-1,3-endoglucanase EglC [Pyricularia oryzae Y34]|uniref:Probable glucan endo-1,3-beta-glucosidase eglC n=2 Tax=Pyricularia oryzae TaxID=318829 RepID=A0AA97P101_PYRO3|nr:GPI-anchored cell wall beta-1,3-endoglucanase EglC [Pyricularia oryzae Y34]